MNKIDNKRLSVLKSIIWRIMGVFVYATIFYIFTHKWQITLKSTLTHHLTFLLVFYLHERVWFRIKNVGEKTRAILKALVYEIILGMGLGGLIVFFFTGSWKSVTLITGTYTLVKIIMYYIYELIWRKKITNK